MWSLIVDTEHSFNFEVETNFTYVQLKNIELKIDSAGDMAQIKANNLITEYVNSSFMSAVSAFLTLPNAIFRMRNSIQLWFSRRSPKRSTSRVKTRNFKSSSMRRMEAKMVQIRVRKEAKVHS